jgi:hypothetical protein
MNQALSAASILSFAVSNHLSRQKASSIMTQLLGMLDEGEKDPAGPSPLGNTKAPLKKGPGL